MYVCRAAATPGLSRLSAQGVQVAGVQGGDGAHPALCQGVVRRCEGARLPPDRSLRAPEAEIKIGPHSQVLTGPGSGRGLSSCGPPIAGSTCRMMPKPLRQPATKADTAPIPANLAAVQDALESAGVIFLGDNGNGPDLRLRQEA